RHVAQPPSAAVLTTTVRAGTRRTNVQHASLHLGPRAQRAGGGHRLWRSSPDWPHRYSRMGSLGEETNDSQGTLTVCSNNTEEKKRRDTARGSEERSYDTE